MQKLGRRARTSGSASTISCTMVEILETRRLFAGNVNVVVDGNTMTFTGDAKSNDVKILVTDGIVVYAVPGTTVNHQAGDIIFGGVPDLVIKTGNGNDTVEIINPDPRQHDIIDTGNGDDTVTLHRNGIAWTGAANLTINTGNGNDTVSVSLDTPFDNEIGIDLTIDNGAGNDRITLGEDIHVNGNLFISGGTGRDVFNDDGLISVANTNSVTGIETRI